MQNEDALKPVYLRKSHFTQPIPLLYSHYKFQSIPCFHEKTSNLLSSSDDNTDKSSAESEDNGSVEWGERVEVTDFGEVATGVGGSIGSRLGGSGQEGGKTGGTLTAFEFGKTIIVGEVNILADLFGGKGLDLTTGGTEGLGGRTRRTDRKLGALTLHGDGLLDDLLWDGTGGLLGWSYSTGSQRSSSEGIGRSQKAQGQSKNGESLHGG